MPENNFTEEDLLKAFSGEEPKEDDFFDVAINEPKSIKESAEGGFSQMPNLAPTVEDFQKTKENIVGQKEAQRQFEYRAKVGDPEAIAIKKAMDENKPITGFGPGFIASQKSMAGGVQYGVVDFLKNVNNENDKDEANWFLNNVKGLDLNAPKNTDLEAERLSQIEFFKSKAGEANNEIKAFESKKAFNNSNKTVKQFIDEYEMHKAGSESEQVPGGNPMVSGYMPKRNVTAADQKYINDPFNKSYYEELIAKRSEIENKVKAYNTFEKALQPDILKGISQTVQPGNMYGIPISFDKLPDSSPWAKNITDIQAKAKYATMPTSLDEEQKKALKLVHAADNVQGFWGQIGSATGSIGNTAIAGALSLIPGLEPVGLILGQAATGYMVAGSGGQQLAETDEYAKAKNLAPNDPLKYSQAILNMAVELGTEAIPFHSMMKGINPVIKKAVISNIATDKGLYETFARYVAKNPEWKKQLAAAAGDVVKQGQSEALSEVIATISQQFVADMQKEYFDKASFDSYLNSAWQTYWTTSIVGGMPGVLSRAANQKKINKNRELNGVTMVATKDGQVFEIMEELPDTYKVVDRNGIENQIEKSSVEQTINLSDNQFKKYQSDIRAKASDVKKAAIDIYADQKAKEAAQVVQTIGDDKGQVHEIIDDEGKKYFVKSSLSNEDGDYGYFAIEVDQAGNPITGEDGKPIVKQVPADKSQTVDISPVDEFIKDATDGAVQTAFEIPNTGLNQGDSITYKGKSLTVEQVNRDGSIEASDLTSGVFITIPANEVQDMSDEIINNEPETNIPITEPEQLKETKVVRFKEKGQPVELPVDVAPDGTYQTQQTFSRVDGQKLSDRLNKEFEGKRDTWELVDLTPEDDTNADYYLISKPKGAVIAAPVQENAMTGTGEAVAQPTPATAINTQEYAQEIRSDQEQPGQTGNAPAESQVAGSGDIQQPAQAGTETGNGQEQVEVPLFANEEEYDIWVSKNSTDQKEVYDAYQSRMLDEKDSLIGSKEETIADYLQGRRINPESFKRFSDKNNISNQLRLSYLSKDGVDIDMISQSTEHSGFEITPQDIVDFMIENPGGTKQYYSKIKESPIAYDLRQRFYELTGKNIDSVSVARDMKVNKFIPPKATGKENEDIENLLRSVNAWAGNKAKLNFVYTLGDVPENAKRYGKIDNMDFAGFYFNKEVYVAVSKIVASSKAQGISSDKLALITWVHEVGSHWGLEAIIPDVKERTLLVRKVGNFAKQNGDKAIINKIKNEYGRLNDVDFGHEYLAHLTEKLYQSGELKLSTEDKAVWAKFVELFNKIIEKLYGKSLSLTNKDLIDIAHRAFYAATTDEKQGYYSQLQPGGYSNTTLDVQNAEGGRQEIGTSGDQGTGVTGILGNADQSQTSGEQRTGDTQQSELGSEIIPPNDDELNKVPFKKDSTLSPSDQKRVLELKKELDKLDKSIEMIKKDKQAKKNELAKRQAEQQTLQGFAGNRIVQTSMFDVKNDFSKESMDKIMSEYDYNISIAENKKEKLQKLIEDIKGTSGSQGTLFKKDDEIKEFIKIRKSQIIDALKNNNIITETYPYTSNTDYGISTYFTVKSPEGKIQKIRISDHEATNSERVKTEWMFSSKTPISEIINRIEKFTNPERFDKIKIGEQRIKIVGGNHTMIPVYKYVKKSSGNQGVLFKLIGERGAAGLDEAETILNDLSVAKEMDKAGKTPKEIYIATSWEKGVDGKWRFEIDDDFKLNNISTLSRKEYGGRSYIVDVLPNLVDDKKLFKAYPELKSVQIVLYNFDREDGTAAEYRDKSKYFDMPASITIWGIDYNKNTLPDYHKSSLIHEIQHAIQEKEGFARGGNPEGISASLPENPEWAKFYSENNQIAVKRYNELKNSPEYTKQLNNSNDLFTDQYEKRIDDLHKIMTRENHKQISRQIDEIFKEYDKVKEEKFPVLSEVDSLARNFIIREPSKTINKYEAYKRLAGEVEARNASKRLSMPIEERKQKLFSETEDVARDQQIVLKDAIEQASSEVLFKKDQTYNTIDEIPDRPSEAVRYLSKTERFIRDWQDSMIAVEKFQADVAKNKGKDDAGVQDFTNPRAMQNLSASRANRQIDLMNDNQVKLFFETLTEIEKKTGAGMKEIQAYMMAKHAPEVNQKIREKKGEYKPEEPELQLGQEQNENVYAGSLTVLDENGNAVTRLLTDEFAKEFSTAFEHRMGPELTRQLWKDTKAVTDKTLDYWFKYGQISKDQHDLLKGTADKPYYDYYVPLRGFRDDKSIVFDYQNNQLNGVMQVMNKEAKGRTSEANEPIPMMLSMLYSSIVWGESNQFKQAFARLTAKNPEAISKIKTAAGNQAVIFGKVYYIRDAVAGPDGKFGITETIEKPTEEDYKENRVLDFKETKNPNYYLRPEMLKEEHKVSVYFNGEKANIFLNDEYVELANALNRVGVNYTTKFGQLFGAGGQALKGTTGWLSSNFTAKNPAFIIPNAWRDSWYSLMTNFVYHGTGQAIKYATVNMPRASAELMAWKTTGKESPMLKAFLDSGGPTGYLQLENFEKQKKNANRLYQRTKGRKKYKVAHALAHNVVTKLLNGLGDISELSARYATFITSVQKGKSYQQAAIDAHKSSVDFNVKGLKGGDLNGYYAFANAAIQAGSNVMKMVGYNRYGKWDPKRTAKTAALLSAWVGLGYMVSYLAKAHGGADDKDETLWYNKINDYLKHTNMVIPTEEGKFYSIPLPEFFRAFYSLGVLYNDVQDGQKSAVDAIGIASGNLLTAMQPFDPKGIYDKAGDIGWWSVRPLTPTAFIPALDLIKNENFAGARVHRDMMFSDPKFMPKSQMYNKDVWMPVKWMTDALFRSGGGNPTVLDRSYFEMENGQPQPIQKKISSVYDWNPSDLEYVFEYYVGGRGKFWIQCYKTGQNLISAWNTPKSETPWKDFSWNDVPVASRIYRTIYGDENLKVFKDEVAKAAAFDHLYKAQYNEYESAAKAGKKENELIKLDFSAKYLRMLDDAATKKQMTNLVVQSEKYMEVDKAVDKLSEQIVYAENSDDPKVKKLAGELRETRKKIIKEFINAEKK